MGNSVFARKPEEKESTLAQVLVATGPTSYDSYIIYFHNERLTPAQVQERLREPNAVTNQRVVVKVFDKEKKEFVAEVPGPFGFWRRTAADALATAITQGNTVEVTRTKVGILTATTYNFEPETVLPRKVRPPKVVDKEEKKRIALEAAEAPFKNIKRDEERAVWKKSPPTQIPPLTKGHEFAGPFELTKPPKTDDDSVKPVKVKGPAPKPESDVAKIVEEAPRVTVTFDKKQVVELPFSYALLTDSYDLDPLHPKLNKKMQDAWRIDLAIERLEATGTDDARLAELREEKVAAEKDIKKLIREIRARIGDKKVDVEAYADFLAERAKQTYIAFLVDPNEKRTHVYKIMPGGKPQLLKREPMKRETYETAYARSLYNLRDYVALVTPPKKGDALIATGQDIFRIVDAKQGDFMGIAGKVVEGRYSRELFVERLEQYSIINESTQTPLTKDEKRTFLMALYSAAKEGKVAMQ